MAAILAGEAAVRIVPSLRNFHSEVTRGLKSQPHSLEVKVNPNLKEADAQMDAWRDKQRLNAVNVPVRADFKQFHSDLKQAENVFRGSSLSKAIKVNLVVVGLDALPALAYAAGSAASGLDALAKSSLALPGLLGGALASAGALATGIHGVSDAFQAYKQDADKASDSARKQQDADRDLVSAKRNLQNAIRDQRREIQDLNAEMRRSSLSEADAVLSIQEDVDRLRQGGFKSVTEYQRAQLRLLQDTDHLSEVRTKNNRTIEDANKANAEGVAQSDKVVDALDRVAKATEAADASKVTKVSDALAKLSPNAAATVQALHGLSDEWKKLVQLPTQDALFAGLDKDLTNLANRTLPQLGQGLAGVAAGLNTNIRAIIASLGSGANTSLISRIFGDTSGGLQNASRGINSLIHGFLQLTSGSADFLPRLGDAATKVFAKFDAWTTKISSDGSLSRWIDTGLQAVDSLGRSLGHVVSIFESVTRAFDIASGHTGGFLQNLDRATGKLSAFLDTARGQNALVGYFKQAKEFTSTLVDAFKDAKPLLKDLIDAAHDWSSVLLPTVGALAQMAAWIEKNTGLLKPLVEGYLLFRTVGPVIDGLTGSWKAYSKIMEAVARQGGVGGVLSNGFVDTKNKMADLGSAAGTAAEKAGGASKVSLFGSLKGLAGFIGPGLAFATAVGGAEFAIHKMGEAHEKAAQQAKDQATALDALKGSLDRVTGAVTQETLAQTATSLQNYSIPGIGGRNILQDIGRTGVASSQQLLQATNPVNQDQRTDILGKLDAQTEQKVGQSDYWKKYGHIWESDGVDLQTLSLAAAGDVGAINKVRSAETKMFGAARDQLGSRPGYEWAKIQGGDAAPSLTELVKGIGTPDSVTSAIALRNTAGAFVAGGTATQEASRAAGGTGQLNGSGHSRYDGFGVSGVYLNAQGDAVIETDRKPAVDSADGQVTPLGSGRWQITLTDAATARDVQKLAGGGLVKGMGGPTDDANLVAMSTGEHVTKAKAVNYYGPKLFDDLNSMRVPKHAVGGFQLAPFIGPTPVPAPPPVPQTTLLPPVGGAAGVTAPPPAHNFYKDWYGPGTFDAPAHIDPAPLPPSPQQGFDLGGAGTGGGSLNSRGIGPASPGSLVPFNHPLLPDTSIPGLQTSTDAVKGLRDTSGVGGLLGAGDNLPKTPVKGAPNFYKDWYGSGESKAPILPLAGPAKSIPPGAGHPLGINSKLFDPGHNSNFNAYMSVRDSMPADQRAPLDKYWRDQGFSPGGATSPASPTAIPHTQTPVTPGAPTAGGPPPVQIPNSPYSVAPGPGGAPVIAPSGPVMGQMRSVIDSLVGTPYVWGGNSLAGVDCSGLASVVANIASGRPPFSGRFDTHSELGELTARGFQPGKGGPGMLTIGWNDSHTAITLPDGTPVSSGENGGVQYGGGGANEGQFTQWMHLPVDAGALDALSAPRTLGGPALAGQLGGGPGGLPQFLQPQNLTNFLGGQAQNIGSGVMHIGLQLLQGLTGINLEPILGAGQQLGNGLISSFGPGGSGGSGGGGGAGGLGGLLGGLGGGSGLNALAGADMSRFVNGQLPLGASPGSSGDGLSDPLLGGGAGGAAGGGVGAGSERWRTTVRQILTQIGPKYGITGANEKLWEDAIVKQIQSESGGNPGSVNNHDSNGKGGTQSVGGLLNFLPSTFQAHNITGGSFMDPTAQIAAAIPYVIEKWGFNASTGGPNRIGQGVGFKSGGFPDGSALVSDGEYITNKNAVANYGPGLFSALNSMSIPKKAIGGFYGKFDGGGFPGLDILHPTAPPAQAPQTPGPLPLNTPAPPPMPGEMSGPGPLPAPTTDAGPPTAGAPAEQPQVAAPSSTGGAPGPGATAPAPDPGGLPQVANALAGLGGALGGGGGGGIAQPGANPSSTDGQDARGTLGAAPRSQDHNLPAVQQGIQGAAQTIGSMAAMAAQIAIEAGAAGGTMGAGAPAGAAAGAAAAQGIQAGAQMAGQIATGAVNILSSFMVGSATPGTTSSASGVPLLPQRQPMQSGVPPVVNQRVHNGDIHVSNLDEFKRTQERMNAQDVMPYVGKYGA